MFNLTTSIRVAGTQPQSRNRLTHNFEAMAQYFGLKKDYLFRLTGYLKT